MPQTSIEKIIAAHADTEKFKPGDIVQCIPDLVLGHDLTAPHAISVFDHFGIKNIRSPEKLVLVHDHFQPAKDIPSAELSKSMREFAIKHGIQKHYDVGRGGICHIIMLKRGLIVPGMLIAGADSHTLTAGAVSAIGVALGATDLASVWALDEFWIDVPKTIKITLVGSPANWVCGKDIIITVLKRIGPEGAVGCAIEYDGSAFDTLPMVDRITIANMSAETGATTCTITASETADEFLRSVTGKKGINFAPDPDAEYADTIAIDVSKLSPVVAAPPSPSNAVPVDILSEVKVDQVFLGSCTNGTIDDFRRFVEVLGENKFNSSTRVIAIPGSNEDYVLAEKEGLLKRIAEAGGAVSTSCCGPCVGGHYGVLAKDEVCLSTANRNFPGRMGHTESEVFLGSPAIAAATAVRGYITHPGEVAG